MSIKEALKELPSINKNNFAKIHTETGCKTSSKRLPVYLSTKDHKSNLIITEKSNVILKFLHNWDKKETTNTSKRDNKNDSDVPKKKIKIRRD